MRQFVRWLAALAVTVGLLPAVGGGDAHGRQPTADRCPQAGHWVEPGAGSLLAHDRVIAAAAAAPVVLLGEDHASVEDHRWQLASVAALHGRRPDMVLGFEMFPRRTQPLLDRWVNGDLGVEAFLDAVEWHRTWGYDAEFYLPLFHFARQHRIPMLALNVERNLVARVAREGWNGIPAEEREGISAPAPAIEAYRRSLAGTYLLKQKRHQEHGAEAGEDPGPTAAEIEQVLAEHAFQRFVEAQLTWDRAMAEAIAAAATRAGKPMVVGILGRGHAEHRWGVPDQLGDLGIERSFVLLPMARGRACDGLPAGLADAIFVVEAVQEPASFRQPLGVMIEPAEEGVRVLRILPDSVAAAAEIEAEDVIVSAAGQALRGPEDLIAIVRRQAPGTWLPIVLRRGGENIERIARFPSRVDPEK